MYLVEGKQCWDWGYGQANEKRRGLMRLMKPKGRAAGSSKMQITTYETTQHNILKDCNFINLHTYHYSEDIL
jgi:hypothetical protein